MKIFGIIFVILFILLIYKIIISINKKEPKIETVKELGQLFNIDLSNDYDCIHDIYSKKTNNETEIMIYYEITKLTLNKKRYYQYNTDYNPLPSYTDNMLINNIEDYLSKFNIEKNQIMYMNCEFADYKVNNILGVHSRPFEIHIYVLKYKDDEKIKVILSTCVPYTVKVDIKDF